MPSKPPFFPQERPDTCGLAFLPTEGLSMTRGKVALVPFPFDDLSTNKVRPAVCLTDPIGPHRHVVLAFITSRMPDDLLESDMVLDLAAVDFAATGLRRSSTLRLHRLMIVSTAIIRRELGLLSGSFQDARR
jgi:mRNA interferase MazF